MLYIFLTVLSIFFARKQSTYFEQKFTTIVYKDIKLTCPVDMMPLCSITKSQTLANFKKTGLGVISSAWDPHPHSRHRYSASCSDPGSCFYEDHYLC